jgi:uncharacterized protein (TIGR00255 family)
MIRSMTGYGQASVAGEAVRVAVELRAVNHRYAELRLRLPQPLFAREAEIRRRILGQVRRGRVDLSVTVDAGAEGEERPRLNEALLEDALAVAGRLRERLHTDAPPEVGALLGIPGLFRSPAEERTWDEDGQQAFDRALDAALAALDGERLREGRHLQQELLERLRGMSRLADGMRERAAVLPALLRDRLVERLRALAPEVQLDPARMAQEAAIAADRSDVTEELVRLAAHLEQAGELLGRPGEEPVGKRLDFLVQEINRETNTINSKCSDLELGRLALALKSEAEKVREQVQNLE